ncbi:MAG: glycerate kinase [Candidatus Dormiibacterota bacterium]|jgi:glycerate kinase
MPEIPHRIRVLIAPNAFKGTLTGAQAARAIREGVMTARPRALCRELPLADGGDGFLETLLAQMGGEPVQCLVPGPLLEPVRASFGWLQNSGARTVVIELAQACGLKLVARPSPDSAARASTLGLGELLRQSLELGPETILVGLGGSASTDGGSGLASALGLRLLDSRRQPISAGGLGLLDLDRVDASEADPRLAKTEVIVACDVDNPLSGPHGAAVVFASQKGADPATVQVLDRGLQRLEAVVARDLGRSGLAERPGAGAAGGAAFGLSAFCGARLEKGASLVASLVGLDTALDETDVVITGEGHFDETSLSGKVTGEVLRRCAQRRLPCLLLVGGADPDAALAVQGMGGRLIRTGSNPTQAGAITAEIAFSQLREAGRSTLLELASGGLAG